MQFVVVKKVSEACDLLKISEPAGHRWLDDYNEKGLEGLYIKYHNSGRHSKLSAEQKEELNKIVENEENLTDSRVHQIIKDRHNVNYSLKQVKTIMKEFDFNYGIPYQIFDQKPKDAESELKN